MNMHAIKIRVWKSIDFFIYVYSLLDELQSSQGYLLTTRKVQGVIEKEIKTINYGFPLGYIALIISIHPLSPFIILS